MLICFLDIITCIQVQKRFDCLMFSLSYKVMFRNELRPLVLQPEVDILYHPLTID
jgi:hypothetical protein